MPSAPRFEVSQGHPLQPVMLRAVSESLAGNGVLAKTDFEVTATANDLEVQVAGGTYFYAGAEHTLGSPETHSLSAGDGTHDRWDIVYFDTASDSSGVREGTAEQYPMPPGIQGDEALLAVVYVQQGATDVAGSDVLNWRAEISNEAGSTRYADPTGAYSADDVGAALDELQEAAQLSAYPLANSDLSNSDVTVNAGDGLTTTGASIALGGSSNLDIAAGGVATDELDLGITPTWTGSHTFDSGLTVTDPVTLDSSMFGTSLTDTEAAVKLPDFGAGGGTLGLLSNTALPSSPPASATLQVGDFILGPGGSPLVTRGMSVQTDSNGAVSGTDYNVFSDSITLSGNVSVSGALGVDNDLTLKDDLADSAGNVVYSDADKEVLQGRLGGPAGKLNRHPLDRHTDYNPTFNTVSVASDYTIQDEDDVILVDTSSSAITLDTPTANNPPDGARHIIIDTGGNASSNPITVDPDFGIDNVTSTTIDTDYGALVMVHNGFSWWTAGGGSGGGSGSGVTNETIVADESGSVGNGNLGTIVATEVPDGGSIEISQASLLLADGQPAPSGCDLILATLDGTGGGTSQTTLISGDGSTVYRDQTGSPLGSYSNSTGSAQTVALAVDNGNFNSGSGSSQDVLVSGIGEVV